MNLLIIDIGTSSMRGILFDEQGEKLAFHQVKYQPEKFSDGRIEQNPEDWTESLEKVVREIVKKSKEVKKSVDGIVITSQRSAIIPVDSQGQPLMNTIMWQDRRNAKICKALEAQNDIIFKKTGAKINTVFSGSRMTWIRQNCPDIMERLYKFVNIPEFLIHYMTGKYHTDVTYGSRSHLMNLQTRSWDREMLQLFQIKEDQLCTLYEPGSILGEITSEFAKKTGISIGIPVISAGGDQQCAAVGQGAFQEGTLSLVTGTGAFLVTALGKIPETLSSQQICNCSSVKGEYIVEANVLTCCSAFDWFCRTFYEWEQDIDYKKINNELKTLENTVGEELVLPFFQGRSTPEWNPDAKATFTEVTLSTKRNEILKALLEGIFFEIRNNIHLISSYAKINQIYISGGLTNSSTINQIQADIYGIPLCHLEDSEATALGALIVALEGMGVYNSFSEAFDIICGRIPVTYYKPRPEFHNLYMKKQKKMNDIYKKLYCRN